MKFSLVVVAVTAFAAVGVAQAETPSLRRMDEPAANIAAGAPHAGEASAFVSSRYCEKFPNAPICSHLFNSEPETRGADADVEKATAKGLLPPICERHPMFPICHGLTGGGANPGV